MSEPRETLEQTLRRLALEREAADRRYNEALTQLDRALQPPVSLPDVPPPLDDTRRSQLNDAFNILPAPPAASSWSQRKVVGLVWRTVAPYFERQLSFNSLLVEHLNRNAEAQRRAHERTNEVVAALRVQIDLLAAFQSRLMQLLQQVTAYVDTRDRETAGSGLILNAAVSEIAEALNKFHESLAAREHRSVARIAAVEQTVEQTIGDQRTSIAIAHQAIVALKRSVEGGRPGSGSPGSGSPGSGSPGSGSPGSGGPGSGSPASSEAFGASLDAYKYVGFENEFRGSQDVIRARLESYVPFFETGLPGHRTPDPGSGEVLDIGCGRGEFIDLLNARGIPARGIDLNHEMVEVCRARGLQVSQADAVGYLSTLPDGSLRGIFAAQVVEHLEPSYLLQFLELTFVKLQPGGRLVLETLNPACWVAFFESYIRDITHKWPLHPETLKYLVMASGFAHADIEYRSPVAPHDRLQPLVLPQDAEPAVRDLAETFNANVEKLNARMFTFMDYAVVSRKPQ